MARSANHRSPTATADLLSQAQAGHSLARKSFAARLTPQLHQLACNLLPTEVRERVTPDDVVHEALRRGMTRPASFWPPDEGGILLRLRELLLGVTREYGAMFNPDLTSPPSTPIEQKIGVEAWQKYLDSLTRLSEPEQAAVVFFVECGMDFEDMVGPLGYASDKEARVKVAEALHRLAEISGNAEILDDRDAE